MLCFTIKSKETQNLNYQSQNKYCMIATLLEM